MAESRPHVLFLIPHPDFFGQIGGIGGHVSHVLGVLGGLRDHGFAVTVISGDGEEILRDAGFQATTVTAGNRLSFGLAFVAAVGKAVQSHRFHMAYSRYVGGFAPFFPLIKRRLWGCPMVLEVNSVVADRIRLYRPIDWIALRSADIVLAISDVLGASLSRQFGKTVGKRVIVLPNGVDVSRFGPEAFGPGAFMGNADNSITTIGYVGVIKYGYGLDDLLAAFGKASATQGANALRIVGHGPYLEALAKLGASDARITFPGPVPYGEVPAILAEMDIVVYPTSPDNLYMSPIKLFEYMAAGKPIIAARTPQTSTIIQHERNGLLYAVGDVDDLADCLSRYIEDPAFAALMASRAREDSHAHSWTTRMGALLDRLQAPQTTDPDHNNGGRTGT